MKGFGKPRQQDNNHFKAFGEDIGMNKILLASLGRILIL